MSTAKFVNLLNLALDGAPKETELIKNLIEDHNTPSDIILFLLNNIESKENLSDRSLPIVLKFMDSPNFLSENIYVLYKDIIINLLLSNQPTLNLILQKIIMKLTTEGSKFSEMNQNQNFKQNSKDHLYKLLKEINELFPNSISIIVEQATKNYPYHTRDTQVHLNYLDTILGIYLLLPQNSKYGTYLLDSCISYLTGLDLNCSCVWQGLSTDKNVYSFHSSFELFQPNDLFDMCDHSKYSQLSQKPLTSVLPLSVQSEKLDAIICLFLNFVQNQININGSSSQFARQMFKDLVTAFDNHIIDKKGVCYVHFLVLYMCHFLPAFAENFVEYCWKKFTNPLYPPIIRHNAICYMTSFLARANFLHIRSVMASLEALSSWAIYFMSQIDISSTINNNGASDASYHQMSFESDLERYADFHRVCQAIFYIFCLKHYQIMSSLEAKQIINNLNWERLIFSKLNPMRFSNPGINSRFASLCRQYNILYCNTIIEHNNRMQGNEGEHLMAMIPSNSISTSKPITNDYLDSFYPFECLNLKKSSQYFTNLFYYPPGYETDQNNVQNHTIPLHKLESPNIHITLPTEANRQLETNTCDSIANNEHNALSQYETFDEYIFGLSPPDKEIPHAFISNKIRELSIYPFIN